LHYNKYNVRRARVIYTFSEREIYNLCSETQEKESAFYSGYSVKTGHERFLKIDPLSSAFSHAGKDETVYARGRSRRQQNAVHATVCSLAAQSSLRESAFEEEKKDITQYLCLIY
jgi:hypothetical protein